MQILYVLTASRAARVVLAVIPATPGRRRFPSSIRQSRVTCHFRATRCRLTNPFWRGSTNAGHFARDCWSEGQAGILRQDSTATRRESLTRLRKGREVLPHSARCAFRNGQSHFSNISRVSRPAKSAYYLSCVVRCTARLSPMAREFAARALLRIPWAMLRSAASAYACYRTQTWKTCCPAHASFLSAHFWKRRLRDYVNTMRTANLANHQGRRYTTARDRTQIAHGMREASDPGSSSRALRACAVYPRLLHYPPMPSRQ